MAQTSDSIQVEFRFGHFVLDGRSLASLWLGCEPDASREPDAKRAGLAVRGRGIDRVLERMLARPIQANRCGSLISFRQEGGRVLWTRTAGGLRALGELTA